MEHCSDSGDMKPCPDSGDMEASQDFGDTEESSDSGDTEESSDSGDKEDSEDAEDSSDFDDGAPNNGYILDFTRVLLPAYLKYKAKEGHREGYYFPYIRRGEDEEPSLTPKQEEVLIRKQVKDSKGFDIDFKMFRSVFNYRPVNFEVDDRSIIKEPVTTKELMAKLSQNSLDKYNDKKKTGYVFEKVLYANYNVDFATGTLYFITFQGKDPSDGKSKHFRAKVCNYYFQPDKYVSCKLKPEKKRDLPNETPQEEDKDATNETPQEEDEDAKRRRLMQEGGTSSSLTL